MSSISGASTRRSRDGRGSFVFRRGQLIRSRPDAGDCYSAHFSRAASRFVYVRENSPLTTFAVRIWGQVGDEPNLAHHTREGGFMSKFGGRLT